LTINFRDSLEKLPIGDFNKRSSNQDVNKILCDTDSVSGKDHEEDNNMEGFAATRSTDSFNKSSFLLIAALCE
jgi:hypothetical protein